MPFTFPTASTGASDPIYDASGLIVGYKGQKNKSSAQKPLVDASGLITGYSGSSESSTPQTGFANTGSATAGAAGSKDPNTQFNLLHQTKSPAIADAASGLMTNIKTATDQEAKSFTDYLNEAKQQAAQNKQQVQQDTATFNTAPTDLDARLTALEKQLATQLGGTNQQIQDANKQYADQQGQIISQLGTEDQNYADAVNNIAAQAVSSATAQNKLYQAASGTPTSDSGDMRNRAISAYLAAYLPAAKNIADMRIGQLTNFVSPIYGQERGNTVAQLQGFQAPMYTQLAQMGMSDAQIVTQLKSALAGRSLQESAQYLQQLGVPFALQQQILGGDLSNLGALSNIDLANTFYGLSSPYEAPSYFQPAYGSAIPPYPRARPYTPPTVPSPVTTGPTPLAGTVNPAQQPTTTLGALPGLPTNPNSWTPADYDRYNKAYAELLAQMTNAGTANVNPEDVGD